MISIEGIYDGQTITPLEKIHVKPNIKVIITFLDNDPLWNKDEDFFSLSGTWEDDRSVDEIIRDIYDNRTASKQDISL
jgi:hypothetical protein